MPKTLFEEVVFGIMMVCFMVYGMVVYNIALATGGIDASAFMEALRELPMMAAIGFIVEFLIMGRIAKKVAFMIVDPKEKPQLIPVVLSVCTCMVMCPTMSLISTLLFKEPSFGAWAEAWIRNLPMALLYQLLLCGPVVRFLFRKIFHKEAVMS